MPTTATNPPQIDNRTLTAKQRQQARTLYITGEGSMQAIANALSLRGDTVRKWAKDGEWTRLKAEYDSRQLERTLGAVPTPAPLVPAALTTTSPQNITQAQRVGMQLQTIEEQMQDTTNPDSLSKLANAHSKLFEAWCVLTGTQRPGVRKAPRGPSRGAGLQVMPIDDAPPGDAGSVAA